MARRRNSYAKFDYPDNSMVAIVIIDGKEEWLFVDKKLQIGDAVAGGIITYRTPEDENGRFFPWFKHLPCKKGLPCPVGTKHTKIKRNDK